MCTAWKTFGAWLWLWTSATSFAVPAVFANADEPSLLWSDARAAFGRADYATAATLIERLTQRYPAAPGTHEARLLLGISFLRLERHAQAIEPLKTYSEAAAFTHEGLRARIALGRAYLGTQKNQEALMTSIEILSPRATGDPPAEIRLGGLAIKTWALLALNRPERASRTLATFQTLNAKSHPNGYETEGLRLTLAVHSATCPKLNPKLPREESLVIADVRKQSACALESVNAFGAELKRAIDAGADPDDRWAREATDALVSEFKALQASCENPPPPADRRSDEEKRKYQAELRAFLAAECDQSAKKARSLIESWLEKEKLPKASVSQVMILLGKL